MGGSDMLAELEKVRASMVAAWMAERNVSSVGEFAEALAQPYMRPACDAVGVDEGSCTLDQLAIVLGLAIVAVAVYTGAFRSGKAGRKRTSSASDDEGERRSSKQHPAHRASRPPERYTDSDDDESGSGASGGAAEEKPETEESLRERRQAIAEGRAARIKEAVDELSALTGSGDIDAVSAALRKHAGKPAECRAAWSALQKHLRTLLAAQKAEAEASPLPPSRRGGQEGAAKAGEAEGADPKPELGTTTVEENPACQAEAEQKKENG